MKPIAPATIAIAMLLFSGCSAAQVIHTAGNTKCKDFITQDEKKQNDEISKMLKDKSGAEPNSLEISATRASTLTYCQTVGNPDSKISEAPAECWRCHNGARADDETAARADKLPTTVSAGLSRLAPTSRPQTAHSYG